MIQFGGFSKFLYYCTVSLFTMFAIQLLWTREAPQVHQVIVTDLTCSQVLADGVPSLSQSPDGCVKELDSVWRSCVNYWLPTNSATAMVLFFWWNLIILDFTGKHLLYWLFIAWTKLMNKCFNLQLLVMQFLAAWAGFEIVQWPKQTWCCLLWYGHTDHE